MRTLTCAVCAIFLVSLTACSQYDNTAVHQAYQAMRDSDIPEITIEANGVTVPWMAYHGDDGQMLLAGQNDTLFVKLAATEEKPTYIPEGSEIVIRFSQPPEGTVTFVDHALAPSSDQLPGKSCWANGGTAKENTRELAADETGDLHFTLWKHIYWMDEHNLPSFRRLRGIQVNCIIDDTPYTYLFLFSPINFY
ncbi:MAG: hypothetical protein ACOX6U_08085 [Oscillospiraceae bacterium]|jgi:hypothetical protein